MKPMKPKVKHRQIGIACSSMVFCLAFFVLGCKSPKNASASRMGLAPPDSEARQAGAFALYAKGLLYASGVDAKDTNTAFEAAITCFRQAIQLDPTSRTPLNALLSSLVYKQRYQDALDVAEAFLEHHPDDDSIRLEAARLAELSELPLVAAKHCEYLLAANPDNRELMQVLVRLYFEAHHDQQALSTIRACHKRFNDDASAVLPIHWAIHFSHDQKDPKRVLQCVDLSLTQMTNSISRAALLTLAAENQLTLGQTNAAMQTLQSAHQEDPDATAPILQLGSLWAQRPEGTNHWIVCSKQNPTDLSPLLILAAAHQANARIPEAIATLRQVYERRLYAGYFPDLRFYLWLCSLLESEHRIAETEKLLREALSVYPNAHEIQNFLAYMWSELGIHLNEADQLVTQALQADPENAAYLDTKGWVLFKKNRPYDALQLLLKASDLTREEPEILDHTGDVLHALGYKKEAITFWTQCQKIKPTPAVADKLRQNGVLLSEPPVSPSNK